MKNFRWDKKYLYWGITAFCVIVGALLFYMFLSNLSWLSRAASRIVTILSPFIWGLVIAYLLCPLMHLYQRSLFTPLANFVYKKTADAQKRAKKVHSLARGLAVLLSVISLLALLAAFALLVGPQLYYSIESIIGNSTRYVSTVIEWLDRLLRDYPEIEMAISAAVGNASTDLFTWLETNLLPQLKDLLPGISNIISSVTSGVLGVLKGVYNVLIGIIVSVYVLFNKETFGAYAKKIIYCIFTTEFGNKVIKAVEFVDDVFIGFISGKILDSTIIGILCYIGCMILRMPYALLVSVIVGVTNVIPFFGPFIGAIPSALIILMESPLQCLIFVIFILLLQQLDGNFIGPKILGSSVGVNGFWIMFSIILGSGLFGFMGMLLGVPVFVIIYTAVTLLVRRKLSRSGLPTETEVFKSVNGFDPETGEIIVKEQKRRRTAVKKTRRKKRASPADAEKADDENSDQG